MHQRPKKNTNLQDKKKPMRFKDLTKPLSVRQYLALLILAPLFFMAITWPSSFSDRTLFWKAFSWYAIVGLTQSLGHSYIGLQLDKWVSWRDHPMLRSFITVVAIFLY